MDTFHLYLDEIGKVIINDLCKLQKKFEKKEASLKVYRGLFLLMAIIFVGYVLMFSVVPYWYQYSSMISRLINNSYHYLLIAILITLHSRMKYIKKKAEKAEKEFHDLRCEVIQRVEELWTDADKWNNRHLFFKEMKDKHNINLYYENSK